eukprot:TRINITY_DN585_c0_g1_i2.p1 TRINITY_DN585_c0_g1~~TRINITY_DN585_c0_g1_i2.p1  ORF type:complete len:163 (-),score=70.56 TRINITY_DN585_c0_g1_i2:235-723(-)
MNSIKNIFFIMFLFLMTSLVIEKVNGQDESCTGCDCCYLCMCDFFTCDNCNIVSGDDDCSCHNNIEKIDCLLCPMDMDNSTQNPTESQSISQSDSPSPSPSLSPSLSASASASASIEIEADGNTIALGIGVTLGLALFMIAAVLFVVYCNPKETIEENRLIQ